MKWEYAFILHDGPAPKATLDSLGDDGWELVSMLQGAQTRQLLYVFKRPVPGSAPSTEPAESTASTDAPSPPAPKVDEKPLF